MRRVTSRSRFPRRPSHLASACALRSCSLRVHVTSISVIRHVPIKSLDYHLGEMIRAKGPCLGGQAVLAASAEDQDLLAGVPSWRAVEASRRVARWRHTALLPARGRRHLQASTREGRQCAPRHAPPNRRAPKGTRSPHRLARAPRARRPGCLSIPAWRAYSSSVL